MGWFDKKPDAKTVLAALAPVLDENTGYGFLASGRIEGMRIEGREVSFDAVWHYPSKGELAESLAALEAAAMSVEGVESAKARPVVRIGQAVWKEGVEELAGVRNIVAIASGKGGVGKSTTAANIALALSAMGAKVGVLDADVYGPSMPTMLGVNGTPDSRDGKTMEPLTAFGMQVMSVGFLVDGAEALVWRGPMATKALEQMSRQTRWSGLDYLIVDMPPGTGDIQLTLGQRLPVCAAVVVTTPQDIALIDARKGVDMFAKVGIPILGIVENMAVHVCSNCGALDHVFGEDGGRRMAEELGVPCLGSLPLSRSIQSGADAGKPTVVADPESAHAKMYFDIALAIALGVDELCPK